MYVSGLYSSSTVGVKDGLRTSIRSASASGSASPGLWLATTTVGANEGERWLKRKVGEQERERERDRGTDMRGGVEDTLALLRLGRRHPETPRPTYPHASHPHTIPRARLLIGHYGRILK